MDMQNISRLLRGQSHDRRFSTELDSNEFFYFVNMLRGGSIDEEAVVEKLQRLRETLTSFQEKYQKAQRINTVKKAVNLLANRERVEISLSVADYEYWSNKIKEDPVKYRLDGLVAALSTYVFRS